MQDDPELLMQKIRTLLRKYNAAYESGDPIATDSEYDALFRYLQKYEAKYPQYITPDSPTRTVGHKPQVNKNEI